MPEIAGSNPAILTDDLPCSSKGRAGRCSQDGCRFETCLGSFFNKGVLLGE